MAERQKSGSGRPYLISAGDRELVRKLGAHGIPHTTIAKIVGVSPPLIYKYFSDEIEAAAGEANYQVAANLFARATSDTREAVTAAIFWLKSRAGWKDSPATVELTGPGGGPVETRLDDQELARQIAVVLARGAGVPDVPPKH